MSRNDTVLLVGGDSGEGVVSVGEILATAAARAGYQIFTFRTFPAEIKGGHAQVQLRVSPDRILSQGDSFDIMLALNDEAVHKHLHEMRPGGIVIFDNAEGADTKRLEIPSHLVSIPLPMTDIARNKLKQPRAKNMVAMGVAAGALSCFETDIIKDMIRVRFESKGEEVVKGNIVAFDIGYEYAKNSEKILSSFQIPKPKGKNGVKPMILTGNESFAMGAIFAGCRFFAGYPITPASDVLEFMAEHLPKFGGTVLQAEDEIASIGAVVGASFSGVKSMTATSGPGLSLMHEMLGLSFIAELPAVVFDVQRAGPSTGLPTKTEQSDLLSAISGSHGDAPRIVLAPTDVEDCFYQAINAFNLSEKYQTPVIVLSEQSLSQRMAGVQPPDTSKVTVEKRLLFDPATTGAGRYKRYELTENGVSPYVIPGTPGYYYVCTGLEHTDIGKADYSPEFHTKMSDKRFKKLDCARRDMEGNVSRFGAEKADIGILGWGASEGAVREAVDILEGEGIKVACLYPKMLYPLPVDAIGKFFANVRTVIIPELNVTGQFASLVEAKFKRDVIRFNKYGGIPFTVREFVDKIKEYVR